MTDVRVEALAWPVVVVAQFFSGNTVMELCDGTKSGEPNAKVAAYSSCVMYLAGIADAEETSAAWQKSIDKLAISRPPTWSDHCLSRHQQM